MRTKVLVRYPKGFNENFHNRTGSFCRSVWKYYRGMNVNLGKPAEPSINKAQGTAINFSAMTVQLPSTRWPREHHWLEQKLDKILLPPRFG